MFFIIIINKGKRHRDFIRVPANLNQVDVQRLFFLFAKLVK